MPASVKVTLGFQLVMADIWKVTFFSAGMEANSSSAASVSSVWKI